METEVLTQNLPEKYKVSYLSGSSLWELSLKVNIDSQEYRVKYLQKEKDLIDFGKGLSERSKDMFCPYPWDNPDKAIPAFRELINHHKEKRDLAYLIYKDLDPIGFCFLWGLNGRDELRMPEFGVGIIDSYQGKGIGGFMVDLLTEAANLMEVDAVELTTDLTNDIAKHLYESRGYELLGTIKNPLEIDQTKDLSELKNAAKFREEYHMARIFRNRENVLTYLKHKREQQNKLFS